MHTLPSNHSNQAQQRFLGAFSPVLLIVSVLLAVPLVVLAGCGSSSNGTQSVTLNVSAASSLTASFNAIGKQFSQAHSGVTVKFNYGGSDSLAQQIVQGAPVDVFASANITQMNVVVKGGQIDSSKVQTFAHNRLVVIFPKNNTANIQTLQDLAKPGIKIVLAAATVPAGQYAITYLTKASADPTFGANYKANVLKNVVSYETDVKSVLTKVSLGEADAGIVYTTDAQTEANSVGTITIPDTLNTIAVYPIAVVKTSKQATVAQQFVDFVSSSAGQAVMAQYGFLPGSQGAQYAPPAAG